MSQKILQENVHIKQQIKEVQDKNQKPLSRSQNQPSAPLSQKYNTNIKTIGNYQFSFDHKLGSGLTSEAYVGVNKLTNELVCVKIVDRQSFNQPQLKSILSQQITCQQQSKSDYIINIYDVIETNTFCFIITELCQSGDLYKLITSTQYGLDQDIIFKFGRDIAEGLLVLKKNGIIHRDIKSQNIMIRKGRAKIGDFGFAIEEKKMQKIQKFSMGSPLYMSLQVLKQKKYSYASDIFAFGIVLYQMLHKYSPWECSDQMQLIRKMETQALSFKNGTPLQLKLLIQGCLDHDIHKRLTIEQIFSENMLAHNLDSQ